MGFRIRNTVTFETELMLVNSLVPIAAASLCCLIYLAITGLQPNMWVVGFTFNICWVLSLRETILSSYLQGVSDTVQDSPYLKPKIGKNRTFRQQTAEEENVN